MFEKLNNNIKKLVWSDISLIKLGVVSIVLFLVSFLDNDTIEKIKSFRWLWLALTIVFVVKPCLKVWGNKK